MFEYVKMPKNLCQYRLFRGAADFGNLQQWDLYESGYSFITVVTIPVFLSTLASQGTDKVDKVLVQRLVNNFVYQVEHEFKGLTGLGGITGDSTATITDGISELQMINKVTEDTSVQVEMKYFEKSGRPLLKFAELFLRGIKDTHTQGKHYWGLIANGVLSGGFENEVFAFLYYITDNTYRNLEAAVLLMSAQLIEAPLAEIYDSEKGQYQPIEISLRFNAFPVTNDDVNREAARLLEFFLSPAAGKDQLIVDTQTTPNFYHIGGNTNIADGIQNAYALRGGTNTDDSSGYVGGSNDNLYKSNYSAASSTVAAKQKEQIYS